VSGKSICAVIVTFNRLNMLQECLEAIKAQSLKPNAVYIVDNASTDGTEQWLFEAGYINLLPPANPGKPWENKMVGQYFDLYYLRMHENVGGAGGFYEGLKRAYLEGYDWIWLMDDDTIPEKDALKNLVHCPKFSDGQTGCLASVVKWTDGSAHKMNMSSLTVSRDVIDLFPKGYLSTRHVSFVSALFPRHVIKEVGLPLKDFFIWYDDVEYTYRISRKFGVYFVLDSIVFHKTKVNGGAELEAFNERTRAKYLYGFRNKLIFLKGMEEPFFKKTREIYKTILDDLDCIVRKKLPLYSIGWILKGLFYKKKIEYVDC